MRKKPVTPFLSLLGLGLAAVASAAPPVPAQWTLNMQIAGSGSGRVISNPAGITCGSDCTEQYNNGSHVTLNTYLGASSVFREWSGDCSGNQTTDAHMTKNRNCVAKFCIAGH